VLHNIQDVQVLGTGNMSGESTGVTLSEETLALSAHKSFKMTGITKVDYL